MVTDIRSPPGLAPELGDHRRGDVDPVDPNSLIGEGQRDPSRADGEFESGTTVREPFEECDRFGLISSVRQIVVVLGGVLAKTDGWLVVVHSADNPPSTDPTIIVLGPEAPMVTESAATGPSSDRGPI